MADFAPKVQHFLFLCWASVKKIGGGPHLKLRALGRWEPHLLFLCGRLGCMVRPGRISTILRVCSPLLVPNREEYAQQTERSISA